jgi:hypothetical protein
MNKKQVIALCITLAIVVLVMLFPAQHAVRASDAIVIKPLYFCSIFQSGELYDCCRYDPAYCDYSGYYIGHDEPAMCRISINFFVFMGEVLLVIFLGGFAIYILGNKNI